MKESIFLMLIIRFIIQLDQIEIVQFFNVDNSIYKSIGLNWKSPIPIHDFIDSKFKSIKLFQLLY